MTKMPRLLPLALSTTCLLAVSVCAPSADAPLGTDTSTTSALPPADVPAPTAKPVQPAPRADDPPMSPCTAPGGDRDLAKRDGYDAMKLGMSEAEVRKAWGAVLRKEGPLEGGSCFHLFPTWTGRPAELALMFDEGEFVRYGVHAATFIAPGGGKIGMTTAEIKKLYPGKVEHQPHEYTNGEYLRLRNGEQVLVLETDAKGDGGKVEQWRVGVPPQVDYVAGCA